MARASGTAARPRSCSVQPSFGSASVLPQACDDIRTVQDLLSHTDVATTMVYTHVLELGSSAVRPLDTLERAGEA